MIKATIDDLWMAAIVERVCYKVCRELDQDALLVRPVVAYFVREIVFDLVFVTDQKVKEHTSFDNLKPI